MSSRQRWRIAQFMFLALVPTLATLTTSVDAAERAKLTTFDKPNGEIVFALSLSPTEELQPAAGHDVVVLFDTSASQIGVYRDDALIALQTVLDQLSPQDRVQLMAVDLDAIPLSSKFDGSQSDTTRQALAKLSKRLPLGSTDLIAGLTTALERFDANNNRPRRVLFVGDGVSRANILETREFGDLMKRYVDHQVAIVSLAIGPKRDIMLLSTLANHTGGHVYVDTNENSPQQAGIALATAVRVPVVWPENTQLSAGFTEAYPALMPPLRSDRDSVLIGTLRDRNDQSIQISGDVNGRKVEWSWQFQADASNEDFAQVARLVDIARQDLGLSLPTAGSAALTEARRVIMTGANQLSEMSAQAMAHGDAAGAQTLAEAALASDPNNPTADILRKTALQRADADRRLEDIRVAQIPDGDFLDGSATALPELEGTVIGGQVIGGEVTLGGPIEGTYDGPVYGDGPLILQGEPTTGFPAGGAALDAERPDGELLGQVEARRQAAQDALRVEVRGALSSARDTMSSSPNDAVARLKLLMQDVRQVTGIDGEVRSQLVDQIESAIREGERRAVEKDRSDAVAAENLAVARERQRILESLNRSEDRQKQILDRFNALMDEGNYMDAQAAAIEARSMAPDSATAELAVLKARQVGSIQRILDIRDRRHRMFAEAMAQIEESMIPFPDEPPIVYPDPERWEELSNRRAKYKAIDLASTGGVEEKIHKELEELTTFDFIELPLTEVLSEIKDRHGITVVLDKKALEDIGIDPSDTISSEISGISLKSALRLMLRDLDLTYVVKDEVLQITTAENALSSMVTKVYSVGDLVLPIQSGGGIGGLGGGGGGLGGGGGGFGGGFFAVDDDLSLVRTGAADAETSVAAPRIVTVTAEAGQSIQEAWNAYFADQKKLDSANRVNSADIRETVRVAVGNQQYDTVIAVIQAALLHGFPQPWMYEALALSLEASGAEKIEIERALMSAVDFSDSVDEIFYVAGYMARNGLEQRALKLFREIAVANPSRPEPYTVALKTAQRIGDQDALRWASIGVLSQEWPEEHSDIRLQALAVAKQAYKSLQTNGQLDEAQQLRDAVNYALSRDCVATVTWTGDADIDIFVEEPTGTVCSAENSRTTAGGVLLENASAETSSSDDGISETYVCSEGFSGRYRLLIQPVYGEVTAGKVNVEVTVAKGTDSEQTIRKQIPVTDKKVVVVFELPNGRRQEQLQEEQVANVAKRLDVRRSVLAQQLNQTSSSDALTNFALDRALATNGLFPRLRSAVGYQPVITTIPEGTIMSVSGVVSADRRYVRITASPLFSGIGDVFNFNITGGANTNPTGGGGGTGGIGGGGGGGLGGGGGGF